jgi:hypothetical protein
LRRETANGSGTFIFLLFTSQRLQPNTHCTQYYTLKIALNASRALFGSFVMMAQYLHYTNHKQTKPMKNSTKTTVILKAIDLELKAMLENDLKNFKSPKNENNPAAARQRIAA